MANYLCCPCNLFLLESRPHDHKFSYYKGHFQCHPICPDADGFAFQCHPICLQFSLLFVGFLFEILVPSRFVWLLVWGICLLPCNDNSLPPILHLLFCHRSLCRGSLCLDICNILHHTLGCRSALAALDRQYSLELGVMSFCPCFEAKNYFHVFSRHETLHHWPQVVS